MEGYVFSREGIIFSPFTLTLSQQLSAAGYDSMVSSLSSLSSSPHSLTSHLSKHSLYRPPVDMCRLITEECQGRRQVKWYPGSIKPFIMGDTHMLSFWEVYLYPVSSPLPPLPSLPSRPSLPLTPLSPLPSPLSPLPSPLSPLPSLPSPPSPLVTYELIGTNDLGDREPDITSRNLIKMYNFAKLKGIIPMAVTLPELEIVCSIFIFYLILILVYFILFLFYFYFIYFCL